MTRPTRVLVLAALLLASTFAAPTSAQGGTRPVDDLRWELAGLDDGDGGERRDIHHAPRNATFDARIRFLAREDVTDTLEIQVERGQVNRTTIPVDVEAGEVFSALVEVSRIREAQGGAALLVAHFRNTTSDGTPISVNDRITIIPQPRAEFVRPPNVVKRAPHEERFEVSDTVVRGHHKALEADWNEEVEVRVRLENPWDVPTRPLPLHLVANGQVLESRTVSPLDPGETRMITVANVTREETTRGISHGRDPVRDSPARARLSLVAASPADPDKRENLWNYTYPAADLRGNAQAQGTIEFHGGLDVEVPAANLTLGEATSFTVEIRNRGGVPARPTPVDLRVGPVPDLAYGVASGTRRSLVVDLAPGESRSVDISFTPRVGTTHEVDATVDQPDRPRRTGTTSEVASPVTLRIVEGTRASVTVGETAEVTVQVEGPADLEGDLGVVATVRDAVQGFLGRTGGTPFSTLLTTGDLVDAAFEPARLGSGAGDDPTNRTVPLEVTPETAGQVAVVPVLRSDGLVHTGLDDEEAVHDIFRRTRLEEIPEERREEPVPRGIVGLDVHPSGRPGPTVVVPPALVLLGVAGVEVHRRWFVR